MRWFLWGLAIAAALVALDRLLLAAERRGWLYYRKERARPGGVGNAVLAAHALVEPQMRALVEQRAERPAESEAAGDPPLPGAEAGDGRQQGAPDGRTAD
jgi:hypothetical protein